MGVNEDGSLEIKDTSNEFKKNSGFKSIVIFLFFMLY